MRSVPRIEFARERLQAGILVDAPRSPSLAHRVARACTGQGVNLAAGRS
jgi:hypothetical protein